MGNIFEKHQAKIKYLFSHDKDCKGNITKTAKKIARIARVPYTDSFRRSLSYYLKETEVIATHEAKILLYDIETSPLISYHWGLWKQNISYDDVIQDWKLLCFSAKWLFSDEIITDKLTKKELQEFDDERLTKRLWKLLDEADIVIGHNCKNFDNKRSTAKFLEYGLNPPSSYQSIDTLDSARKKFSLTSNRLDAIGSKFGLGRKVETPKGLWRSVMEKDYKMLEKMAEYCEGDTKLLEDVYLFMRPYIQPHPNLNLFITQDIEACPSCASTDLKREGKAYTTTVSQYDLYRCHSCGALSRNRKNKKLLSSVP